jgi:hypothetical protein
MMKIASKTITAQLPGAGRQRLIFRKYNSAIVLLR